MEYVISTKQPFEEIETLTRGALERHGFTVQQTFSLHSATGALSGQGHLGYSVFMLYGPSADRRPLGLLTLYRRGGQTVINPMLSPAAGADVDANLVGALVVGELELCVDVAGAERCIDLRLAEEEQELLMEQEQDSNSDGGARA
jgi:hypothetical protein